LSDWFSASKVLRYAGTPAMVVLIQVIAFVVVAIPFLTDGATRLRKPVGVVHDIVPQEFHKHFHGKSDIPCLVILA
jgi:hypothetical protein